MKRLNQTGSHVLAAALVVLVLGVVGFAGYKVTISNKAAAPAVKTSTAAPSSIKTTADLSQADSALDSSSTQVNSSLDDSSLDSSLDDML